MKSLPAIAGVVLIVGAAATAGYFYGKHQGFDHALKLQDGVFVGTLDALQMLRDGDTEGGIRRVEALCFSSGNTVYRDKRADGDLVPREFLPEIVEYRNAYRANESDWTPAEEQLEEQLKDWQGHRVAP